MIRSFYERHPNTLWWALAALCVIAAIATLWTTQQSNNEDSQRQDRAIVAANIDGCRRANSTREGVRALIDQQIRETQKRIHESQTTDYSDLFPGISKERLQGLIDKQIKSLHATIGNFREVRRKVRNTPCRKLFPRL